MYVYLSISLLSLAKEVKLSFYTVPTGIEPRAVAWQSVTQRLRYASSTHCNTVIWHWFAPFLYSRIVL